MEGYNEFDPFITQALSYRIKLAATTWNGANASTDYLPVARSNSIQEEFILVEFMTILQDRARLHTLTTWITPE